MFTITNYIPGCFSNCFSHFEDSDSTPASRIVHAIEDEVIDPETDDFIENAMCLPCGHSVDQDDCRPSIFRCFRSCPSCNESVEGAVPNLALREIIVILKEECLKEDFQVLDLWKRVHEAAKCPVGLVMMKNSVIRSPCGHSLDYASYSPLVNSQRDAGALIRCASCRAPVQDSYFNQPLDFTLEGIRKQIVEELPGIKPSLLNFILDEIEEIDRLHLTVEDFMGFKEDAQEHFTKHYLENIALLKEEGH